MLAVLVQPVAFFQTMPTTRQWLGVAFVILALVGASEVRRVELADALSDGGVAGIPSVPSGILQPAPDSVPISPIPIDAGVPPDIGVSGSASQNAISANLVTALMAAGNLLVVWLLQAVLLMPIPMFNGHPPSVSRNLQVAVWASVPLGLLALLQLIYYAVGGVVGVVGVSMLLERWEAYALLPVFAQSVLHSLTSHLTLFWLWSLTLLFTGARRSLRGRWWAAALIVIIWVMLALLLPVVTGAVQPYSSGAESVELMPQEPTQLPDGGMPTDGLPPGVSAQPGVLPPSIEVQPVRSGESP